MFVELQLSFLLVELACACDFLMELGVGCFECVEMANLLVKQTEGGICWLLCLVGVLSCDMASVRSVVHGVMCIISISILDYHNIIIHLLLP